MEMSMQEHRFAGLVPPENHLGNENGFSKGNPAVLAARALAEKRNRSENDRFEHSPTSSEWKIKHHGCSQAGNEVEPSHMEVVKEEETKEILKEMNKPPVEPEPSIPSQRACNSIYRSMAKKLLRATGIGKKVFIRHKGQFTLQGTVQEGGMILCSHCNELVAPVIFQQHAGDKTKKGFMEKCFTIENGEPVTLVDIKKTSALSKDGKNQIPSKHPLATGTTFKQTAVPPSSGTEKETQAERSKMPTILDFLSSQKDTGCIDNIFASNRRSASHVSTRNPRFSLSQPSPSRVIPYASTTHPGVGRLHLQPDARDPSPSDAASNAALGELLQQLLTKSTEENPEHRRSTDMLNRFCARCDQTEKCVKDLLQNFEHKLHDMEKKNLDRAQEWSTKITSWIDVMESRIKGFEEMCLGLPESLGLLIHELGSSERTPLNKQDSEAPIDPNSDMRCISLFPDQEVKTLPQATDKPEQSQDDVLHSLRARIRKARFAERLRSTRRIAHSSTNPFALGTAKNALYAILAPQASLGQGLAINQIEKIVHELRKVDRKVWPFAKSAAGFRSILHRTLKNDPAFISWKRKGEEELFFLRRSPSE